jgi:hypothetical protein
MLVPSLAAALPMAWWLTIEPEPQGTSYRGVDASALSVPLKRVSALSCVNNSQFSPSQCAEIRFNGLGFRLTGDFNGDGRKDLAETVVAELPNGTRVAALIISEAANPRKNQMFVLEGNGFSVVRQEGKAISWSPCMECGHASEISWDPKRSVYVEEIPEIYGAGARKPSGDAA